METNSKVPFHGTKPISCTSKFFPIARVRAYESHLSVENVKPAEPAKSPLEFSIDLANWYFGPIRDIEVISCDLRCPERIIQGEKVKVDAEDYVLVRCFGCDGMEIYCQADLITPAFSQYVEVQA